MDLWKELISRIQGGRPPHALLLTGQGREEAARTLAAAYLCEGDEKPCQACLHCRKVREGTHPDLGEYGREGLPVDTIRALRKDAWVRPNEAQRKVYLLHKAEDMSPQGQNALLKLLEEGPLFAVFLFLVRNPEQLLPTLRSRCETIRLNPGGEGEAPLGPEALALASLLREEKPGLPFAEFCVSLEKKPREEISALLDETIRGLCQGLGMEQGQTLRRIEALQNIRAACEYNISSGHISGLMLAALAE